MSEAMTAMTTPGFNVTQEMIAKIKAEVNYDLIKTNNYDKYGDGEYISVETVTDILNETFGFTWSWEIVSFIDKDEYVVCHGRLTIPGLGIRDGIGQAKADKQDNSAIYSSAASFAFKKAAERVGIARNIFNKDGIGFDVFEPGTIQLSTTDKGAVTSMEQSTKPQVQSKKQIPSSVEEKAKELKEAYELKTKSQFVAFAQIWNPEIKSFSQITPNTIKDLHAYAEENPEEFEDFNASIY